MRNKGNKDKSPKKIFQFFKGMAQRPFMVFVFLLAVAAFAAGWIFLNFQQLYFFDDGQAVQIEDSGVFSKTKAEKYRKVFLILEQREKEYNSQAVLGTVE